MERYEARDVYKSDGIRCFTVSDILVYAGSYSGHPPEEAWEGYLEVARRLVPALHGLLVVTSGGSTLTPRQRAGVRSVYGTSVYTAVLTDSLVTRSTLTALRWFGIPIAGFSRRECREALGWMKREQLWEAVEGHLRWVAKDARPISFDRERR